jgi:hypothetical protein
MLLDERKPVVKYGGKYSWSGSWLYVYSPEMADKYITSR